LKLKALFEELASELRNHVTHKFGVLNDRIGALETREVKDGAPGEKGDKGDKGEPGESIKGDKGDPGADGKDGAPGAPGEKGAPGLNGKDGLDGKNGLDGLAIVPVVGIDHARTYRQGTWAAYNGGLVRAMRDTDALNEGSLDAAGWAVMVEGRAALAITQAEDLRSFTITEVGTSGKQTVRQFSLPVVLYRGIYRDDETYQPGDQITWAGSQWIKMGEGGGRPGDEASGWVLACKKGRDGKDGKDGRLLPPPAPVKLA
jgi:hypothetical protein